MAVLGVYETYDKVVAYGKKKHHLPWMRLIILSLWAGAWIGIAGHVSTYLGGAFYVKESPWASSVASLVYGSVFPVGFIGVVFTHSELFTGNTMAMALYAIDSKRSSAHWIALVKNLLVCTLGNFSGAAFVAFFFSWLTGDFDQHHHPTTYNYLSTICKKKLTYNWGIALVKAIGCNVLVCTATWSGLMITDAIGKLVAIWFFVSAFCFAGFEHIIANFYTLSLCSFAVEGYPYYANIYLNWLPVWLGNLIAGTIVTGACWSYVFKLTDKPSHEVHPPHKLDAESEVGQSVELIEHGFNSHRSTTTSE